MSFDIGPVPEPKPSQDVDVDLVIEEEDIEHDPKKMMDALWIDVGGES